MPSPDLGEPKRAEEAFRASEATFRALLDAAPDGIMLTDLDGHYVEANVAVCRMLGYSRSELLRMRIVDLIPPAEEPRLAEELQILVADSTVTKTSEWTVRRKDGLVFAVEVSARLRPDGGGFLAFFRDVSPRKRVEREREESLRWMRAVLEQSPVGLILVHGPPDYLVEPNRRAQQMVGMRFDRIDEYRAMVFTPDGRPVERDRLVGLEAPRGERIVEEEYVLHNTRGGSLQVLVSSSPIVGSDGMVFGAVLALQDISASKELERLRAEWSSVVAHDLRQPLGTISISANRLARLTEDPELAKPVARIRSSVSRLTRMVGDLMDLSRLDARRLELVRQRTDLPALVRGTVERVALDTPDRPFDVHAEAHVPEVDVDPDRIAQVMENLLTNAVKYGRSGTPIGVSVARDDHEVTVTVSNEGRPLSAEELFRLFERFQRTSSAKNERIPGAGLGLYITRSLVEAHGGRITAASTPGGVTSFRFTLPAGERGTKSG
jgi:PAS domain S-box-containing protein